MSGLHPTPTRLQLLRDVRAGLVFQDRAQISHISGGPRVDNRITEMRQAGWVELVVDVSGIGMPMWQLTTAGLAVLDAGVIR